MTLVAEQPEQETPPVEEQETPTPEQELASLKAEIEKTKALAEEKDKGFRSIQQKLSEEQKKSQQLESFRSDLGAVSAKLEVLGGLLNERQGAVEPEEDTPRKKVNLGEQFKSIDTATDARRLASQLQSRAIGTGLSDSDARIENIRLLTVSGNFAEADRRLREVESEINKPPVTPTQTEEEKAEKYLKDVDEAARKILENKGLLKTETGGPSPPSGKYAEIEKGFAEGTVDYATYADARSKRGL